MKTVYLEIMNEMSIDIVIPSFRFEEKAIMKIIELPRPENYGVQFYIVVDNPRIQVPPSFEQLQSAGRINLLRNVKNMGPSASRNKGIRAGNGKWVLLLDDDIEPIPGLLNAYAAVIEMHPGAIGFAGPCLFPAPFNAATQALFLNGSIDHFIAPEKKSSFYWAPTANVMLNREKMDEDLFDEDLRTAEDIDFLVRNALRSGEKYLAAPHAIVLHQWWGEGRVQTRRQFQYGVGASRIAEKIPIKNYTYRDFTNTSETVLLWVLFLPIAFLLGWMKQTLPVLPCLILAEWLTSWLKVVFIGKQFSPSWPHSWHGQKIAGKSGICMALFQTSGLTDLRRELKWDLRSHTLPHSD